MQSDATEVPMQSLSQQTKPRLLNNDVFESGLSLPTNFRAALPPLQPKLQISNKSTNHKRSQMSRCQLSQAVLLLRDQVVQQECLRLQLFILRVDWVDLCVVLLLDFEGFADVHASKRKSKFILVSFEE